MARILLWCGLFAGSIMTRSFEESVAITAAVALFVFVQALIAPPEKIRSSRRIYSLGFIKIPPLPSYWTRVLRIFRK